MDIDEQRPVKNVGVDDSTIEENALLLFDLKNGSNSRTSSPSPSPNLFVKSPTIVNNNPFIPSILIEKSGANDEIGNQSTLNNNNNINNNNIKPTLNNSFFQKLTRSSSSNSFSSIPIPRPKTHRERTLSGSGYGSGQHHHQQQHYHQNNQNNGGFNIGTSPLLSPSHSLASSTDSMYTDTLLANSCSLINLSSSPQSVPSSPPTNFIKSSKFNNHNNISNNTSPLIPSPLSPFSLVNIQQQQQQQQEKSGNVTPISSPRSPTTFNYSPPTSPIQQQQQSPLLPSQQHNQNNNQQQQQQHQNCTLNECLLCQRGQPELLIKSPTWASIMRVVFYTLHHEMRDKLFFSLKTDVYEFMVSHWDILCFNKKKTENWHKQIQDMLSHSKNIFESGMDHYKQNGYWRLKHMVDPWVLQKVTRKGSVGSGGGGSIPSPSSSPQSSSLHLAASACSPRSLLSSPPPSQNNNSSMISNSSNGSSSGGGGINNLSPIQNTTPFSLSMPSSSSPPHYSSSSAKAIPTTLPLHLMDFDLKLKRSSIDMLLSSSLESLEGDDSLSSPRKIKKFTFPPNIGGNQQLQQQQNQKNNEQQKQQESIRTNDISDDEELFIDELN